MSLSLTVPDVRSEPAGGPGPSGGSGAPQQILILDQGIVQAKPITNPEDFSRIPDLDVTQLQLLSAYLRKSLADEYFLTSDRANAAEMYSAAISTLRAVDKMKTVGGQNTKELLLADALYRQQLLSVGADYWGGNYSTIPGVPAIHLQNMRELLDELEAVNSEVTESIREKYDQEILIRTVRSSTRGLVADMRAAITTAEVNRAIQDQYESRIKTALEKKQAIESRIKAAVDERRSMQEAADRSAAAAGAAVTSAVTAALGVDPKIKAIIEKKDVENALLETLTETDLINSVSVIADFRATLESAVELNDHIAEVSAAIESAKELKEQVDGYISGVAALTELVQRPSLERLRDLGLEVMNDPRVKIPEEFQSYAEQVKESISLVSAARAIVIDQAAVPSAITKLEQTLVSAMPDLGPKVFQELAAEVVRQNSDELSRFASTLLEFAASSCINDERSLAIVIRAVFELWPNRIYENLPTDLKNYIQRYVGEGAGQYFTERGITKFNELLKTLAISVVGDQVVVQFSNGRTSIGSLRSLLWQVRGASFDVSEATATQVITSSLRELSVRSEDVRLFQLANLSDSTVEELSSAVASTPRISEKYAKELRESFSAPQRDTIAQSIVATEIGSMIMKSVSREMSLGIASRSGIESSKLELNQAFTDIATKEIAKRALDAALPGLGTVGFAVSDYLNATAKFDQQMTKVRHLDGEIAGLSNMAYQEASNLNDAQRTLGVFKAGLERDEIYRRAALERLEELADAENIALEANEFELELVSRRRPYLFYLSEKLREEYDAFDRSFATWVNGDAGLRQTINDLVLKDPSYVRLVLDSDIHLFKWLDRRRERERGSADNIVSHWRQLFRLANDVCKSKGCVPGNTVLGSYSQTGSLNVKNLVTPSEWQRFEQWSSAPIESRDDYSMLVAIAPEWDRQIGSMNNVRVIDVHASVLDDNMQELDVPVVIRHPGYGLVRRDGMFHREQFREVSAAVSDGASKRFDLASIALRWASLAKIARRPFEGYPMFTTWKIIIPSVPEPNSAIRNIRLRFAYYFSVAPFGNEGLDSQPVSPVIRVGDNREIKLTPIWTGLSKPKDCVGVWAGLGNDGTSPKSNDYCQPLPVDWGLSGLLDTLSSNGSKPRSTITVDEVNK